MGYSSTTRVRNSLGSFGSPRTTEVAVYDVFSSMADFTSKVGTWTASSNEALVSTGTSTIALNQANNVSNGTNTVVVKLATTTQAGVYFNATTSASNYQAVTIDIVNNKIHVITTSTGTQATSSISFTGTFVASTFYTLRVENSGQTAVVYVDGTKQTDVSGMSFTTGVVGLYASYGSGVTRFGDFQVSIDQHYFTDALITTAMAVADRLVDRRTQATFSTALASQELYDWFDQAREDMPYVLSRSFNTLPTFYRVQGFADTNNILSLRHRPVYSTITLQENTAGDAATPSWTSRTQANMSTDGDFYVYNDLGVVVFIDNYPRNGHQNIRVTYSYGATTIVEEIAELSTRYAVRQLLIGYGAGGDGLDKVKKENEMYIGVLETWVPQATLMGCVGKSTSRVT